MPEGAIYVGRPTKWGNLWRVGLAACGCRSAGECNHNLFRVETAAEAVEAYRAWVEMSRARERPGGRFTDAELAALRGHDLVCWCPLDRPCHADVLLVLANADD